MRQYIINAKRNDADIPKLNGRLDVELTSLHNLSVISSFNLPRWYIAFPFQLWNGKWAGTCLAHHEGSNQSRSWMYASSLLWPDTMKFENLQNDHVSRLQVEIKASGSHR
jgi:hypothetical protein